MIGERLHETVNIIERAIKDHDPVGVFVAYSGGKDSAVMLDIASRLGAVNGVMAIDTGLGADGWCDMINRHVAHYKLPLAIVAGKHREWYTKNVHDYGFGYTRGHHTTYYRMLKQEAIRQHMRDVKTRRNQRVVYLTGVRRAESAQRAKAPPVIRSGGRVSVNALINWADDDMERYLQIMPHYSNPFYDLYGNSGDCYCGWTCKHTVEDFKDDSPQLYEYLRGLSQSQVDAGQWRYGDRPPRDTLTMDMFADMPDDSFCINCNKA